MITRIREWLKKRREFKHRQWCRRNGVIFLEPSHLCRRGDTEAPGKVR